MLVGIYICNIIMDFIMIISVIMYCDFKESGCVKKTHFHNV